MLSPPGSWPLVKMILGCGHKGKTSGMCNLKSTGRTQTLFVEREVQEGRLQHRVRQVSFRCVLTRNSQGRKDHLGFIAVCFVDLGMMDHMTCGSQGDL